MSDKQKLSILLENNYPADYVPKISNGTFCYSFLVLSYVEIKLNWNADRF